MLWKVLLINDIKCGFKSIFSKHITESDHSFTPPVPTYLWYFLGADDLGS